MLKYVPTNETFEEIIVTSKNRAKNLGALNNSIREGAGNFVGYVGQISIAKLLGIDEVDTFDHDLQYQDMTLEVKSKDRTVDPALYYDASIAKTSMHQNPDIYVFVSVTIPANTTAIEAIWIMGWISKKEYFNKATFYKKGDIDPSNNFTFRADCYNLPYNKLHPIKKLLQQHNQFKLEEHIDWN